jgi:hypothetical protein
VNIAIATITRATNSQEAEVLLDALAVLNASGAELVIADRSTHPGFRERLCRLARASVLSGFDDLAGQVRGALQTAAPRAPFVLYTEPDKKHFFETILPGCESHLRAGEVWVPGRDEKSFRTFSRIQQRVETFVNATCADVFGIAGDYTYGPIGFPQDALRELDALRSDLGWGWRLWMMRQALAKGFALRLTPLNCPCPPGQEMDNPAEWRHRLRQLVQNVKALAEEE